MKKLTPNQINLWLLGQPTNQTDKCIPKNNYSLRKRVPLVCSPIIPFKRAQKSFKEIAVASQMALCTAKAIRIWENLTKENAKNNVPLKIGQIVCARMSGHRPWPSKIVSFQKNGIKLTFFGTHKTGTVKKSEVIPYEQCRDVLEQYLKVPISNVTNNRIYYHLSFIKACSETTCNGETLQGENDS